MTIWHKTLLVYFAITPFIFHVDSCSAQEIGDSKWVKGPTYSAQANWNETDSNGGTPWQIPDGWVVIDYRDNRQSKYGRAGVNISYVQAGGRFVSSQEIGDSYNSLIHAAYEKDFRRYAGKLREERDAFMRTSQLFESSHNTIVVTAKARGSQNTFDRRGASIKGFLQLKLVYLGTNDDIANKVSQHLALIRNPEVYVFLRWNFPPGGAVYLNISDDVNHHAMGIPLNTNICNELVPNKGSKLVRLEKGKRYRVALVCDDTRGRTNRWVVSKLVKNDHRLLDLEFNPSELHRWRSNSNPNRNGHANDRLPNGIYTLEASYYPGFLQVHNAGGAGANVSIFPNSKNKKHAQWVFRRNSDGTYSIRASYNHAFLQVHNAGGAGSNVSIYPNVGHELHGKWILQRHNNGNYSLKPAHRPHQFLQVHNAGKAGANVSIYPNVGHRPHGQWRIERVRN